MTLEKAFAAEPQLPEIYEADEEVKSLIDMARKLEGVTRNAGKHAGGVVISPTKSLILLHFTVMQREITQLHNLIKMTLNMPVLLNLTFGAKNTHYH